MMLHRVRFTRGQMKIQQMAFVLLALILFLSLIAVVFVSLLSLDLSESAERIEEDRQILIANVIADSPELSFERECSGCIDFDKAFILSKKKSYENFWDVDYLAIEKIGSEELEDCTDYNLPECSRIVLVEEENYGSSYGTFAGICYWSEEGYTKCEIGRVLISAKI